MCVESSITFINCYKRLVYYLCSLVFSFFFNICYVCVSSCINSSIYSYTRSFFPVFSLILEYLCSSFSYLPRVLPSTCTNSSITVKLDTNFMLLVFSLLCFPQNLCLCLFFHNLFLLLLHVIIFSFLPFTSITSVSFLTLFFLLPANFLTCTLFSITLHASHFSFSQSRS